jgi:hypothetical protein
MIDLSDELFRKIADDYVKDPKNQEPKPSKLAW